MKKLLVNILLMACLAGIVSAQTYTITTLAGSPTNNLGDGGSAGLAALAGPVDSVADAAGNIYISDPGTQTTGTTTLTTVNLAVGRIRKIDKNGIVSTLTTGIANPRGMVLDAAGAFLYVADTGGHRIRKVDTTTGANTVVACNGSAGFSGDGRLGSLGRCRGPRGIALDASGNVYYSDTTNNRIRRVDAVTGIMTTIAGRGAVNSTINATPAGGAVGDGGPATQALLGSPEGIVFDSAGNLYVADTGYHRVRKITPAGIISTVAGTGVSGLRDGVTGDLAQFSFPRGVSIGKDGNLLVADAINNRIRLVNLTSGVVSTVAGGGNSANSDIQAANSQLNSPSGARLDSAGNMLISDTNNSRVRIVDGGTGLIRTLVGTTGGRGDNGPAGLATLSRPSGVGLASNGDVYITDTGNNRVRKVDVATGIISAFIGGLSNPGCVIVNSAGAVLIGDRGNHRIRQVDATGVVSNAVNNNTVAGATSGYNGDGTSATGAAVQLNGAACVASDSLGTLYIADTGNHAVRQVTNGTISTIAGQRLATTNNIGVVVGSGVSGAGGDGGPGTAAFLNGPQGVGVNAAGTKLCIADTGNHVVRELTLNGGNITTIAGIANDGGSDTIAATTQGWTVRLNTPSGCVYDSAGAAYIADTENNRVVKVDAVGIISIIAGGGTDFLSDGKPALTARLFGPTAIAVDAAGNVFFTDRYGFVKKLTK